MSFLLLLSSFPLPPSLFLRLNLPDLLNPSYHSRPQESHKKAQEKKNNGDPAGRHFIAKKKNAAGASFFRCMYLHGHCALCGF